MAVPESPQAVLVPLRPMLCGDGLKCGPVVSRKKWVVLKQRQNYRGKPSPITPIGSLPSHPCLWSENSHAALEDPKTPKLALYPARFLL